MSFDRGKIPDFRNFVAVDSAAGKKMTWSFWLLKSGAIQLLI
jgi:hypothetical protein